jgi:hypothetical protein
MHLIFYRDYMKDFGVAGPFADRAAAEAASGAMPDDRWTGLIVAGENDVRAWTPKFRIDAFNALAPEGAEPIKRFESADAACRRLMMRIADAPKTEPPKANGNPAPKENEVAATKKVKIKKPKAKPKHGDSLSSTQEKVLKLIERANGATIQEIMESLELTEGTARNNVGRVRRKTGKDIAIREVNYNRSAYTIA